MSITEKQKMLTGELYRPGDSELQADQAAAKAWMVRYNAALGEPQRCVGRCSRSCWEAWARA